MLKRYLLFVLPKYYPCGGQGDIQSEGDTIAEMISTWKPFKKYGQHNALFEVLDLQERRWLKDAEFEPQLLTYLASLQR
jgi:hypothetical protein